MILKLKKYLSSFENNQFLRPIIESLNQRELFFFIVLIGLLPSIADYSLFKFSGISALNNFFTNPFEFGGHAINLLLSVVLLIGLFLIYRNKKYYYVLGLLPLLLTVVLFIFSLVSFQNVELFAIITSIFSKIAFVFFIVKAKIRSLSFFVFVVLMFFALYNAQIELGFFQSIKQSFLFVFFCLVFKFIYTWFSQNYKTFAKVKRKRLLLLTLKSILVWSPILLFAIPAQYITDKLEENAKNSVYDNTLINRYYVASDLKFNDLLDIKIKDTFQKYSNEYKFYTLKADLDKKNAPIKFLRETDEEIINDSLLMEIQVGPYKTFNNKNYFADISDEEIAIKQVSLIKSLVFINHNLTSKKNDSLANFDFVKVSEDFKNTYSIVQKSTKNPIDRSDYFIMEFVSKEIEKIIINKRFPGKSGLELDAILSINEAISANQDSTNLAIETRNQELNKSLDKSEAETEEHFRQFEASTNQFADSIDEKNNNSSSVIIDKTNEINQRFSDSLTKSLDSLSARSRRRMKAAPEEARAILDNYMPKKLKNIIPYFKETPCQKPEDIGWLEFLTSPEEIIKWIGCRVELMIKQSQNRNYREVRKKALIDVKMATANFLDEETIRAVEADIESIKKKTDSLNHSAASKIVRITTDASREVNENTEEIKESIVLIAEENKNIIQNEITRVQNKVNKHTAVVRREVNRQYEIAKNFAANGVTATNRAIEMNKLFGNLLLALIIFKSFFYVFSRVAFNRNEELFVSVINEPKTYANGSLKKLGIRFSIPANHKETYFVVRKFRPTGRAPKVGIHCWTASVLKRLKTKTFLMNHISIKRKSKDSIDFSSLAGAEFIEWTLTEGEEVVFDYSNLVAITSTVKLKSDLSLRLTSTLFGKSFFHIAEGPGKLILMTKGVPLTANKLVQKSLHIDRLVAWQKCTEFSVVSELNIVDMYFSGLYLQRQSDDIIIIDADETSKKRSVGMVRFISKFLFPF